MRTRIQVKSHRERCDITNFFWSAGSQRWVSLPSHYDGILTREETHTMIDEGGPRVRPNAERVCAHTVETRESVGAQATVWLDTNQYATGNALSLFGGLPPSTGMAYAPVNEYPDLRDLIGDRLRELNPLATAMASLPFIGELHQTISMIRKPWSFLSALAVPKKYHQLPVGQVLSKAGLGPASNGWLAWSYGWKPLFSDILNSGVLLATAMQSYKEYRSGSTPKTSYTASSSTLYSENLIQRQADFTVGQSSTRGWATFDLQWEPVGNPLSFAQYMTYKLGLRPEDLFNLAWELTPYSFVADWFLPVGKWIGSIRQTPIRPVLTNVSYHRQTEQYVEASRKINGYLVNGPSTFPYSGWYRGTKTIYQRNTDNIAQGSGPAMSLTQNHTLSGLALIAQQLMCPVRNWKA